MPIRIPRPWELPESAVTDETIVLSRRRLLAGAGALGAAAAMGGWMPRGRAAEEVAYPFPRNPAYEGGRPLTPEGKVTTYNNFYEFGSHKKIWKAAQRLSTGGWEITIDGMVEKEQTIDVDDLLARMPREERIYRHRCVEAWSMVVPWSGFPLAALIDYARPLSGATYVRFETFLKPHIAPGQKQTWFPWPFTEGLTIPEARNELAFVATGLFGKPLENQNGAPIRLVVPWKYGFKSIKSIVRITFTDQQPKTFWNTINNRLYGFWANVNPDVPFPDWSQAEERVLGTDEKVPTQIYNGYGEQVAGLYKGLDEGRTIFF
ncbi:MAG: protein-methionine-sulfoxide reductase catalytic subunit MsrP [Rhodospirillaceae bacterium]|nr:protein-methionine-sulfoxide reductase catalytic subunit MsrP [Rhodospirillaceae bacterium]